MDEAAILWGLLLQAAVPSSAVSPALLERGRREGGARSAIPLLGFPVFKEPSEQPITFRYCQYITLEKVGVSFETHHFLFSKIFLQAL